MINYEHSDSIVVLNLSNRSYNALVSNGIITIGELVKCTEEEIKVMRNVGDKSVIEIVTWINELTNIEISHDIQHRTFVGVDGIEYIDERIESLNLGVRAKNCLKSSGINFYSDLLNKLSEELIMIPNMGKTTLSEIETLRFSYIPRLAPIQVHVDSFENTIIRNILHSIKEKIPVNSSKYFESIESVKYYEQDESLVNKSKEYEITRKVYDSEYVQKLMDQYLLDCIDREVYGSDEGLLLEKMPEVFKHTEFLYQSLNRMFDINKISLLYEDKFIAIKDSFLKTGNYYLKEREYEILIHRFNGHTLESIGELLGITRERVRQIEFKGLKRLRNLNINFLEDRFSDVFTKYEFTKEAFIDSFNSDFEFNYLSARYELNQDERKPLESILYDENVPKLIKKMCENSIYKNYILISNELVPKNRNSITNYILKNYAINDMSFEDFRSTYFDIVGNMDDSDPTLFEIGRGYENKIASSNLTLWKQGKKFRYYNICFYDYTELLETLNLKQYKDIELSTLKFIKLYPDLMKNYDIRDEYELHNLLKKIFSDDIHSSLEFGRMPNLQFGNVNRDNQVLSLLRVLAPISKMDFAKEYQEEYGSNVNTVLANFLNICEEYLYEGIYRIDLPSINNELLDKINESFVADFYTYTDVDCIFKNQFDNVRDNNIFNPQVLKQIGYRVYSNYLISDRFNSAKEYFMELLTGDDIVNTDEIRSEIKSIVAYSSCFYKLKSDYEIVEFLPRKFINIKKLNEFNIRKEDLVNYCEEVSDFVGDNRYFSIESLRKDGFDFDKLEMYGFNDYFYSSLITEDKMNFSHIKIGGAKVFVKGIFNFTPADFLEYIVYSVDSFSIYIYDLKTILKDEYGVRTDIYKIIQTVKESDMHYDPISEKIFADYDTYYEEV